MRMYDLDKSYDFEGLLIIQIDSPLSLYGQSSLDQIFGTSHEFLGRFRKVDFDGNITKEKDLVSIPIPEGGRVAIDENGKVYALMPSGSTYVFDGELDEAMIAVEFPVEFLGRFNTATMIHMDDFNEYMDTFKVDKPKSTTKKRKVTRLDVMEDLLEESDDAEGLNFN